MAKDPVCGVHVHEEQAAGTHKYQGERFYFCSQECLQQFKQNPHRYADLRASQTIRPSEQGPCVR